MAIDGPDTNTPDSGAGHLPTRGRLDGPEHVEPKASSTRQVDRSGYPARFSIRAEDRREEKLGSGDRHPLISAKRVSKPRGQWLSNQSQAREYSFGTS